jgi:hypothetical protein
MDYKMGGEIIMRVCQFYALGNSEKELLAYDEYDSHGSGRYLLMMPPCVTGIPILKQNQRREKKT